MNGKHVGTALAALAAAAALATPALAQNEQFIPQLVYRTGAYAPNGIPVANGIADYYTLIDERDGGINGVKIVFEECDTGYATDRGVECYERLKGKGSTGAAYVFPLSTGITFALTEKASLDKIPLITMGYGRSESRDGSDLPQGFRTRNYVRDWLPIRREQCAKRVSRKSRWSRSSARQIASRCQWWPNGTGSASRRSTPGASVSAVFRPAR